MAGLVAESGMNRSARASSVFGLGAGVVQRAKGVRRERGSRGSCPCCLLPARAVSEQSIARRSAERRV